MTGSATIMAERWIHPAVEGAALRLTFSSGAGRATDWALLLPGSDEGTWAVFLHGHGSGADQLFNRPDLRDLWLPAMRAAGVGILSPHLGGNAWMGPAAVSNLRRLLTELRQAHGARRFVLVGGSMGGTGALIYACRFPEDVAGVVALCPATDLAIYWRWCRRHEGERPVLGQIRQAITAAYGGTPQAEPATYQTHSAVAQAARLTMPLAIAHGSMDRTIPIEQSRRLLHRLPAHPALRYEEQPEGNHDAPLAMLPAAFAWLLTQLT